MSTAAWRCIEPIHSIKTKGGDDMTAGTVIEFEPLSSILGARVHGVDLTEPDSAARTLMLREAFSKYCVLCFPHQTISNDDQIRFARNFGRADADFMGKPTAN